MRRMQLGVWEKPLVPPDNRGEQVLNLLPEDEETFRFHLASMGAGMADATDNDEGVPTLTQFWSPHRGAAVTED